jgi:site-specific DNA-cytosine methylase
LSELADFNLSSSFLSFDASGGEEGGYGFVLHGQKCIGSGWVQPIWEKLELAVSGPDRSAAFLGIPIIAVGELIACMKALFALVEVLKLEDAERLSRGESKRTSPEVLTVLTDNQVIKCVLSKQGSTHSQIQWLSTVVSRLEAEWNLVVRYFWIASASNGPADLLSRRVGAGTQEELLREFEDEVGEGGYHFVDDLGFEEFLEEAGRTGRCSLRLPEDEVQLPVLQEIGRYTQNQVQKQLLQVGQSTSEERFSAMVVFGGGSNTGALANRVGLHCKIVIESDNVDAEVARRAAGEACTVYPTLKSEELMRVATKVDVMLVQTPPPSFFHHCERNITALAEVAAAHQVEVLELVMLVDRWEHTQELWSRILASFGWRALAPGGGDEQREELRASELGDPQNARRIIIHYELKSSSPSQEGNLPWIQRQVQPRRASLGEAVPAPAAGLYPGKVSGELSEMKARAWRNKPILHGYFREFRAPEEAEMGWLVKVPGKKERLEVIHASRRRVSAVEAEAPRDSAVQVLKSDVVCALAPKVAVWGINGAAGTVRGEANQEVLVWEDRVKPAYVRKLSPEEIMRIQGGEDEDWVRLKAVCGSESDNELRMRIGRMVPASMLEAVLARLVARLHWLKWKRGNVIVDDDAGSDTRGKGGTRWKDRDPRPPKALNSAAEMLKEAAAMVNDGLATGTEKAYSYSAGLWFQWAERMNISPFLQGGPKENEDTCLMCMAVLRREKQLAVATIRGVKSAVRMLHIKAGFGDPFERTERVALMLRGFEREEGPKQKLPVTMDMLRAIIARKDPARWDDAVLCTGLMLAFAFLLRSQEIFGKGQATVQGHAIKMKNLIFLAGDRKVSGREVRDATEVLLVLDKSKTDQAKKGCTLNLFRSKNKNCPIRWLQRLFRLKPDLDQNPERYVMSLSNGSVLHRDKVATELKLQAEMMGLPRNCLSVISLRAGGASALWDAGYKAEDIKARGRWRSECWRIYVWESRNRDKTYGEKVLASSAALHTIKARER